MPGYRHVLAGPGGLGLAQLEKNHVFPSSSQYEALARYSVSREVPCSVLKWETVLGSLDATPKVP